MATDPNFYRKILHEKRFGPDGFSTINEHRASVGLAPMKLQNISDISVSLGAGYGTVYPGQTFDVEGPLAEKFLSIGKDTGLLAPYGETASRDPEQPTPRHGPSNRMKRLQIGGE